MTTETWRLRRLGYLLEWATIAWNVGEAVLTIALGVAAGSLGLVGFGFDSTIEVFASLVVVWHIRSGDGPGVGRRTASAHRRIGGAFLALAAALIVMAVQRLVSGDVPRESPWGIAYLAVTVVVMLGLAVAKRRVGERLDSGPLRAEAAMTFLDGLLASGVLASLVVTALWDWTWADPLAALAVAGFAVKEGVENLRESGAEG